MWSKPPPETRYGFLDIYPWVFLILWGLSKELIIYTGQSLAFAVAKVQIKAFGPCPWVSSHCQLFPTPTGVLHPTLRTPQPTLSRVYILLGPDAARRPLFVKAKDMQSLIVSRPPFPRRDTENRALQNLEAALGNEGN